MSRDQLFASGAERVDDVVFVSGHARHDAGVAGKSRQFVLGRKMPDRETARHYLQ